MVTRRDFMMSAASGLSADLIGGWPTEAFAAQPRPLIEGVKAACRRLAGHGWNRLLHNATGGELDITAADLRRELEKPLRYVNRSIPGLADFAPIAVRGVDPGKPATSLLYHIFASPDVVEDGTGARLGAFPTLAEIQAIENYVYGAQPPTLADLRRRADGAPLAMAVFAVDYRTAADTVQGRHADLCFSRTGIARTGSIRSRYDPARRAFDPLDPERPFAFRTVPQRFAAYLAIRVKGDKARHGPRDALASDAGRDFWVPLHKLFDGPECIAGLDLRLELKSHLINEKLRRLHRYLETQGIPSSWSGDDLDHFPFVIRDEMIGALSQHAEFGPGVLEPRAWPLANRARYRGHWLTFEVPPGLVAKAGVMYFSGLQILPGDVETAPAYSEGLATRTDRPAPEYVNIRRRVRDDGTIENLNERPDMMAILRAGGYRAQHFIDFAGDGWIAARCPQLEREIAMRLPAYCLVSPPDFFPSVSQRDLTHWWRHEVPEPLRKGLWAIPPIPLSERRIAANITLPAGFSVNDTTVTAIVSHPTTVVEPGARLATAGTGRYSGLPDNSPGVFDPGWDASQGIYFGDPDVPVQNFMQAYGLGTPFVEDVKLCAALGSYWPGVAPDSGRTFTPLKHGPGFPYPWPTVIPLTDEEIGIMPVEGRGYMPWDGVRGPQLTEVDGRRLVAYPDIERVDYLDNLEKMTATLLSKIDLSETKARVLAMAAVYWSLGIRNPEMLAQSVSADPEMGLIEILKAKSGWAVLSFRKVVDGDPDLKAAEQATGSFLPGKRRYRFHVFRPGSQIPHPHDFRTVLVEPTDEVLAYAGNAMVLSRRGENGWKCDKSIPTS